MTATSVSKTGYPCPVCGFQTRIKDSRRTAEHFVRRRRLCLECGYKLTTVEIPLGFQDPIIEAAKEEVFTALNTASLAMLRLDKATLAKFPAERDKDRQR